MGELENWMKVIESKPDTGWPAFYKSATGHPVSSTETLLWCVDQYGVWPTFEAILAAQRKRGQLDDPLPYVLAVAQSKWKNSFMQLSDDGKYNRGLQRSKRTTAEKNAALEEKLQKAREQ